MTENLTKEEWFQQKLASTSSFEDLLKLCAEKYTDPYGQMIFDKAFAAITTTEEALLLFKEIDTETENGQRVSEKAMSLAVKVKQLVGLWHMQRSGDDEVILEKMLELACCDQDLDTIYYQLAMEEAEIARRDFIRKLFDKADKLDYGNNHGETHDPS